MFRFPHPAVGGLAQVSRTAKGKQLPVYTDYKNGRTRVLTVVRKVAGDVEVRLSEPAPLLPVP